MKRFIPNIIPSVKAALRPKANQPRAQRQLLALICAVPLLLSACSDKKVGTIGTVDGFFGGVVADEPRAALVGRDALSAGGTAADAAAAMYLALATTLPSRVGLGGGGLCLVYDRGENAVELLDFWPRPGTGTGTVPVAVPAALRGIYALHARYGRLNWSQIVAPAERFARFGIQASRAYAGDIRRHLTESESRRPHRDLAGFLRNREGRPLNEADHYRNIALGAVFSSIRFRGPGVFYDGEMAQRLVAEVAAFGGTLTGADLRDAIPRWRPVTGYALGNETVYFTASAGTGPKPEALKQDITRRIQQIAGQTEPERPLGQSGFATVDRAGNAVVCKTSMGLRFGTERVASGFGLLMAEASPAVPAAPVNGGILMVNENSREFRYAATGSAGTSGQAAVLANMTDHLDISLDSGAGVLLAALAEGGYAHHMHCPQGIPTTPESCRFDVGDLSNGLAGHAQ